jgi:16S rRNA (uracil1498-N3)-methyltransferase
MGKFFVSRECIKGDIAVIGGDQAHHILDVMRLKKGERIQAFDGTGRLYEGKILDTAPGSLKLKIERVREYAHKSNLAVTLVQALPKRNRMDYVIEKSTELGVDAVIPISTARTIVKLDQQRQALRKIRWQKLARDAAKQCTRTTIPKISGLALWEDVLSILVDFDLKLLACLSEDCRSLKDVLQAQNKAKRIALFIGPEGDFSPEEISQARQQGCIAVSLGGNVLRTDTACLCALAMINYELRL